MRFIDGENLCAANLVDEQRVVLTTLPTELSMGAEAQCGPRVGGLLFPCAFNGGRADEHRVSAAHTACIVNQVPLLVVFVPEKFRVYKDYCTFRPDNPCVDWVLGDLPGELGARVAALGRGIGFLDLNLEKTF